MLYAEIGNDGKVKKMVGRCRAKDIQRVGLLKASLLESDKNVQM